MGGGAVGYHDDVDWQLCLILLYSFGIEKSPTG